MLELRIVTLNQHVFKIPAAVGHKMAEPNAAKNDEALFPTDICMHHHTYFKYILLQTKEELSWPQAVK